MTRDYLTISYRQTRAYREACRIAEKQRAGMNYRRLPIENVSGVSASAACRRGRALACRQFIIFADNR